MDALSHDMSGYQVDIVFCIDATGSMKELIDNVKRHALSFPDLLSASMAAQGRKLEALRAKVIAFRDFNEDDDALLESEFFELPGEAGAFSDFLDGIQAAGGGDLPENSLEALAAAMHSDWIEGRSRRRQVIVLFTDAPAIPLGESATANPQYPAYAPKSLEELEDWWENGVPDGHLKLPWERLVLFAPDAYPWNRIAEGWDCVYRIDPVALGEGCAEVSMETIVENTCSSICHAW